MELMDTELLKTFLEVSRTRHFGRAAENLFLTQSAISARIRQLEESLGVALFTRTRNDIQLTPAGVRMSKYAESILSTWNRARQDAALKAEDRESLAIGGMFSLWDIVLQDWLGRVHIEHPELTLLAEAGSQDVLVRKLLDGAIDLAFMWEPPQMTELELEEIGQIRLVLVSTRAGLSVEESLREGYIRVDWGTSFAMAHGRHFPDIQPPAMRVSHGRMALALLLQGQGTTAYIAEPMVQEYIARGELHRVVGAPVLDRAFHAVTPHAIVQRRAKIAELISLVREMTDRQTAVSRARG
jgi:DNA-binding transcriptional LysR family regulator